MPSERYELRSDSRPQTTGHYPLTTAALSFYDGIVTVASELGFHGLSIRQGSERSNLYVEELIGSSGITHDQHVVAFLL